MQLLSVLVPPLLIFRRITATTDNCTKYSPFVVAQVQINLAAIIEDVDLAVLVGGEGAGVDVYVRVDLDAAEFFELLNLFPLRKVTYKTITYLL